MKIFLYGCPSCGRIGWARGGERVDGAGEDTHLILDVDQQAADRMDALLGS